VRRRETLGDAVTDGQCIRTVHCDGDHPKADGVSNVHRCIVVIAFEHAVTAEKTFVS
jgi:hypothetical protein